MHTGHVLAIAGVGLIWFIADRTLRTHPPRTIATDPKHPLHDWVNRPM